MRGGIVAINSENRNPNPESYYFVSIPAMHPPMFHSSQVAACHKRPPSHRTPYTSIMARGGGECLVQNPHGQEASLVQNIFRVSKHAGPLTDGITPEDFSHVLVPIGASILVPALCCTCLIFLHELHVGAGAKPWLASHDQNSTVLLQVAFLTFWFVPYLIDSMMIPLSLEYALAMGESATASGVFLGMAAAGSTVGIVLGQSLTSEADWNQRYARKLFIYFYGLSVMTMPLLALILQASIDWSLRARRLTFWLVIALNFVNTCIGSIPIIAWSTMWLGPRVGPYSLLGGDFVPF